MVVPNDVEVPGSPRRHHVTTLVGLTTSDLGTVHRRLAAQLGDGVVAHGTG
jgi:hypothetical protein